MNNLQDSLQERVHEAVRKVKHELQHGSGAVLLR